MSVLRKLLFLLLLGISVLDVSLAQTTVRVTGVVKDEKGEELIGVQVVPVGANRNGVLTDAMGRYTVTVPSTVKQISFNFTGYIKQVVDISGRKTIDILLKEDTKVLDAVVVTAMGIERKSKSLTYATQSVDNKELTRIKEPNFVNALRGKSAGLLITPNNSGAGGGSTKITLRGQTSILGSNQPLIVLDGVPLSSGPSGQATDLLMGGATDGGDILSTINPDDIASITVLKGPNAAALYGSSANNGVLIIKTKSGREGKIRIDVSSSTMADMIATYPKLQTRYGRGASYDGWGKRVSEMTEMELASAPYLTNKKRNTIREFFDIGFTQNTSVTISGGTEKQQSYFSYANTYQTGIMPMNKFMRHNVLFKQSFDVFDRLKLDLSLNYIHQDTKNRPVIGKAMSPLHALYRTPGDLDMRYFRHNYEHVGSELDDVVSNPTKGNRRLIGQPVQTWPWFDQYLNNPYWLVNRMGDNSLQDRMLATLAIRLKLIENLTFQSRTNLDYIQNRNNSHRYATTYTSEPYLGGYYWTGRSQSTDFFQDALLSYTKDLTKQLSLQATVGMSYKRATNRNLSSGNNIDTLGLPNVFLPQNNYSEGQTASGVRYPTYSSSASEIWGNNWEAATFATATLGYDEKIYLDASYRIEWAKSFQQFARANKYISFDFYSLGANALLDKLLPFQIKDMNSLKLRASFSVVGNPIPNEVFAAQGINFRGNSINPVAPKFENPRPETTTSFEVGLDGAFFNNRLDFDLTYYNSTLKNQFLRIGSSTGQSIPVNTGKIQNWGVELSANYRWNLTRDLIWKTGVNLAYNDNKILETYTLPNGREFIYVTGPKDFKIKYLKGGAYGDIYVNSFRRDANGQIQVVDGKPILESGTYDTKIGNATARFNFGFNNTFSYKNFQLYFLIDGKIGGKVMSLTQADMDHYGVSERSADARDRGYVLLNDGSGRKLDPQTYYEAIGGNPIEDYIYDATNLRLREMSLGYTFNDLLGNGKNLSLSLLARNLFFLYKNAPVDPDISQSAANGFGGIDAYAMPTTRTFGFSAKVTF